MILLQLFTNNSSLSGYTSYYSTIISTGIGIGMIGGRHQDQKEDASLTTPFYKNNIFPRSQEWYQQWTHASKKKQNSISNDHLHDDTVVVATSQTSANALLHYSNMKQRYASVQALPDFYARGIGWIHDRLGMGLTAIIVGGRWHDNGTKIHLHNNDGPVSIFIVDTIGTVKCNGDNESWMDIQPPLTMWVRVYGMTPSASTNETEIFAGTALPHNLQSSALCAWRYDFVPRNEGHYSINVKVLTFNGFADPLSSPCIAYNNTANLENYEIEHVMDEHYLHHRGVHGFKFYGPEGACCDACKRARNCKMFSFPGRLKLDHCELYFDYVADDVDFLDRDSGLYLGRYRNYSYVKQDPNDFQSIQTRRLALSPDEITAKEWRSPPGQTEAVDITYFIGCGWSALMSLEHPCHYPSDDLVFGSGEKFELVIDNSVNQEVINSPDTDTLLPPCIMDDEKLDMSNGRWVRHPFPDDSDCPPIEADTSTSWQGFKPKYYGDRPKCWHRDNITLISNECAEGDCGLVIGHRWVTDLKREMNWYGWWQPFKCQYHDMGDNEIQQCVDKKQIARIDLKGMSIRNIIGGYLEPKMANIKMMNETSNLIVTLDTLAMPHLLWGKSINEHVEALHNFPDVPTDIEIESYFVSGFYYTSEREPHVTVDRSLQYSKLAYDILTPKGYKMINAFDVTAAFAYDTDGQVCFLSFAVAYDHEV